MIYSVQTSTFNPSSQQRLANRFSRVIINDMVSRGIVKQ